MLILHSNTNHSSSTLSLPQVQELLVRGLTQERATASAGIQNPETWVREQLLARVNPAALTVKGWEAVATAVSLSPVTSADQVQQLVSAFTDNIPTPAHEKSLESVFYLFARHHKSFSRFSFEELHNLTRLIMDLYREHGPEAYRSINTILHQCDSCILATAASRIPGTYFLPEGMLRPEHLESLQRRIRICLLAQDKLHSTDLARYIVEHSSLPQEQREFLSSRWEILSRQFLERPTGLDVGALSIPYGVAGAVTGLEKINALVERLREHGLKNFDTTCVMNRFGHCSAIVESYSLLQKHPFFAEPDGVRFFELIASGHSLATLTNLIRFAVKYHVSFRLVPAEIGVLQPELIDRYLYKAPIPLNAAPPVPRPGERRTVQELIHLGRGLGSVVELTSSLSPQELDRTVELYDHLATDIDGNNFPVVAEFARDWLKRNDRDLQPRDLKVLKLALELHTQLQRLGHNSAQAMRMSLDYATNKAYRNRANRQVLKSLLQANPEDYMSKAITTQARDTKLSDQIFLQTLTLAGSIYNTTWAFIPPVIGDSSDHTHISIDIFRAAMAKIQQSSLEHISEAVGQLLDTKYEQVVREHLLSYIHAPDKEKRRTAGAALQQIYNLDTGPYPQWTTHDEKEVNPDYRKMWNEVMEVYRGIFDLHYGFGHSTFECKTPPGAADWMLLRFAFDSAFRVNRLVHTDANAFPGPGCLISGLKLERLFATNPATPNDPYSLFKDAWQWVAHVIEDLPRTSFLLSRGVKMFIGPDEPTYRLDGIHYALVAWNEHFDNSQLSAAALVPVSAIKVALRGRVQRIEELGDRPGLLKARPNDEIGLKFHDLRRACEEMRVPFLNLGWASNIGGLCNAYAPCSAPYFEWERQLSTHDKDGAGHVHKSHIKGHYVSKADAETTRLLLPLRQAHDSVYGVASAYLGLSDLFRISLALWHKGLTLTEQMGEERELELDSEEEQESLSANELKMLDEAYRWNDLHQRRDVKREDFPILCIAHTFDHWNVTSSPVMLDTYDLTLSLPDGSQILLDRRSGRVPDFLVGLWASRVRPLYRNHVELDLRFLDRQSVRWSPVKK